MEKNEWALKETTQGVVYNLKPGVKIKLDDM